MEKLSKKPEMINAQTIPLALEQIAPYHGNRKAWLHTIARKTGLSPRRVKSLYYRESVRLWTDELEAIQRAVSGHHNEAVQLLNRQGELSNEINAELKRLFFEFLEAYRRKTPE